MSLKKLTYLLTGILLLMSCMYSIASFFVRAPQKVFTIMLDPAGDAQNPGRQLEDSFERGITLQYAEKIKQVLESTNSRIRVVLTRFPGETVQPLQNASFANRLAVDLYLSIHFYHEHETKPRLYLYTFSYNDDFVQPKAMLSFYSYDKAHLINSATTNKWSSLIAQALETESHKGQFDYKGQYKIPFKPLIGITAPAIALEAGLKNKDDWNAFISPLADALLALVKESQPQ